MNSQQEEEEIPDFKEWESCDDPRFAEIFQPYIDKINE